MPPNPWYLTLRHLGSQGHSKAMNAPLQGYPTELFHAVVHFGPIR